MSYVVGVDIGGTFTDCVVVDSSGTTTIAKAPSTPPNFETGFVNSMRAVANELGVDLAELIADSRGIYHGCTVGTNALVEGNGARVALLTTRGHRDSIFFMQSGRRLRGLPPEQIAAIARHEKPAPLVPKSLVGEIDERITFDGEVLVKLDPDAARRVVRSLVEAGAEAFAISLLWSVANPVHEDELVAIVRDLAPDAYVSAAARIVPRTGEYERTVATVINSVVGPTMDGYLSGLEGQLRQLGYASPVQVMTCSGGLITADEARRLPVLTIGSGPVAGVIGSAKLGEAGGPAGHAPSGAGNIITADMGGTTLDVGVIVEGAPLRSATAWHSQYEYYVPTLDVRSIGAGGGSIVRFNASTASLSVGPTSAGALPGPVCYGRGGTEPTVTDADLALGYVGSAGFAAGSMRLDRDAAMDALERAGRPLGLDGLATAAAAVRIVDNRMADAIRLASIQQGYDPRRFTLYGYGGAGAIHGAALARELGIQTLLIPLSNLASGWSAFGVASAEALVVEEMSVSMREPFPISELAAHWRTLEERVASRLERQGVPASDVRLKRLVDMRYTLQVNQVQIAAPPGIYDKQSIVEMIDEFEREYARLFGEGTGYAKAGYALTLLRVEGRAVISDFSLTVHPIAGRAPSPRETRPVMFLDTGVELERTPIYDGTLIGSGQRIDGPSIIEYPHTSVVVPGDCWAQPDALGSVVVTLEGVSGGNA